MAKPNNVSTPVLANHNGDKTRDFDLLPDKGIVRGIGSYHKSLKHNEYGEVSQDPDQYPALLAATGHTGPANFELVGRGEERAAGKGVAQLTNSSAGEASDRLTFDPHAYSMPPAPPVLSNATAAEMVELYWMALLRDEPLSQLAGKDDAQTAADEITAAMARGTSLKGTDPLKLRPGIDLPGAPGTSSGFTAHTLFRLGLPGEEIGPIVSQFFLRDIEYGAQSIDAKVLPYKKEVDYLTGFEDWLAAQDSGKDGDDQAYSKANEKDHNSFEDDPRYISTMRDLARFVNKDALHQAYFNAALLLLSGGARWTAGNPYSADSRREAGFGLLGGPHILALVSEVATRALKAVWFQKWFVHLRLRPEAYGGLAHVQKVGVNGTKRPYGLPGWLFGTTAAARILDKTKSYLLPMAFTPGSPTHPAYGAGHATVAGACVTILKAYFQTLNPDTGEPLLFNTLGERDKPYGKKTEITAFEPGTKDNRWQRVAYDKSDQKEPKKPAPPMTIEGELNKLAQNVAMGRSMGGVHWRTDNTRSLALGEALAAEMLCDISQDAKVAPVFTFRTFARRADGQPKTVVVGGGQIHVDGHPVTAPISAL